MKLVYAVDKTSYNDKDHIGVVNKVEAQMRLFEKNGIQTTLCQYVWEGGYPQIVIEKDTDLLYFRRIEPSVKLLLKLRQLRKINPGLRIVMEIPTYPFADEETISMPIKRRINRRISECVLHFYIDRIVLIGQQKPLNQLYGIRTICVNNGVDFDTIKIKQPSDNSEDEIHMLCVSGCFFWHGYDRVIEGMNEYYHEKERKEKIIFHIVGEGQCLDEYKGLAKKYGLFGKYVFFYGRRVGDELDELYNKCDIAVECLGIHRKKLYFSSSLKSREYAAKGIPMIVANDLDIYQDDTRQYIKKFPADNSPIDMIEIINFYQEIYKHTKDIAKEVRQSFYRYCAWDFVYKPVLDYINFKERE